MSARRRGGEAPLNPDQSEREETPLTPAEADPILAALADEDDDVRAAALRAAVRLPLAPDAASSIDSLARRLLDGQADAGRQVPRPELIAAASLLKPADIRERVRLLLRTGSPPDRQAAVEGLATADDPIVIPDLLTNLRSGEPRARLAAAAALSGTAFAGAAVVAGALRAAADDDCGAVALLAAIGVARSDGVEPLLRVLRRVRSGQLDLSMLADWPLPLVPLPAPPAYGLVRLAVNSPDEVAGRVARALTAPVRARSRGGQDSIGYLFRGYERFADQAPGLAAQVAWVASQVGVHEVMAGLAPFMSVSASQLMALRMAADVARFRRTQLPLVIGERTAPPQRGRADIAALLSVGDLFRELGQYAAADEWHRRAAERALADSPRAPLPEVTEYPRSLRGAHPPEQAAGADEALRGDAVSPAGADDVPATQAEPGTGRLDTESAETVRRLLQGRLPERVRPGELVQLLVRVAIEHSPDPSPGGRESPLDPFRIGPYGLPLTLVVEAPGFAARSPLQNVVLVPPEGNSGWALFELTATGPGVSTITVMAFNGGARVGVLPMQITADRDLATSRPTLRVAAVKPRNREPGDLSLVIHYDRSREQYRYQLIDWTIDAPEESRSAPLLARPKDTIENLVAQLNQVASRQVGWDAAQTLVWLKNKGLELWRLLIPEDLQRGLLDRLDDIQRMMIYTDGDVIPWELLHPSGSESFLVERFPVARWLKGLEGPVTELNPWPAAFVLPEGSPSAASAEIDAVKGILQHGRTSALPLAEDLTSLLAVLQAREFGALHFASHNTFAPDAADTSSIMFGNQPFVPSFLEEYRGDKNQDIPPAFRQRSPLIFMNACRTDGQAALFTQLYGWAQKFLSAGAGAFIGSSWEVVDSSARTFAEAFYQRLEGGAMAGEALLGARNAIREATGDPTWLAYTFYGDPKATVTEP